jgi:hypothetical protein
MAEPRDRLSVAMLDRGQHGAGIFTLTAEKARNQVAQVLVDLNYDTSLAGRGSIVGAFAGRRCGGRSLLRRRLNRVADGI